MRRKDAIPRMRANLVRRRDELRRWLTNNQNRLEVDREVGDSVDAALDAEYHEISSQLAEVESNELQQLDVALERMDSGDYGVCEDCGRNIPLARLQAAPYTTACIHCQRIREKGGPRSSDATYIVDSDRSSLLGNWNGENVT